MWAWIVAVLLSLIAHWELSRRSGQSQAAFRFESTTLPENEPGFQVLVIPVLLGLLGLIIVVLAGRARLMGLSKFRQVVVRLRASEGRYRKLVAMSPVAVVVLDEAGRIIEANESALRLHGVADSKGVLFRPALSFVAPEDRGVFEGQFRQLFERKQAFNMELGLLRQNGSRFFAEISVALISSRREGQRVIAVARDLSDQQAMMSALRSSEKRYRRISELTSDLMSSLAVGDGGLLTPEWTAGASERITGYTVDELHQRGGVHALIDERDLPRARFSFASVLSGGSYSEEFRFTTKSGQAGWVHCFGLAEQDPSTGKVVRLYQAFQDISARKAAEEQLSAKGVQLEAVLEHSPSGIVVLDCSGNVILWNLGAERILGWSAGEVLGKAPPGLTAEQRDLVRERFSKGAQAVPGTHHQFVRKDGVPVEVLITTSLYPDTSGAIAGMIGVFDDVTEIRRSARLAAARLRLSELAQTASLQDLLRAIVDEAEKLTGSRLGFLHFVDQERDQVHFQVWSSQTEKVCKVQEPDLPYPLAGVWADCVREAKPIIHNNFDLIGRDMPPGHASVAREMVVPVLRDGKVTAVLGVGNSLRAYAETDVNLISTFAAMAWDIVVRKKAEEDLRASEERLRAIFDSVPDPVYLKDSEGRYTHVNSAFERYFRTTAKAVLGKTREEAFKHGRFEEVRTLERQALSGVPVRRELQLALTGEERDVEIIKIPILDNQKRTTGICVTARDVTERKRTEAALRRAHSRAQRLLEVAGVMIIALAPDGTIALINRKGCEILGCEQEDVLGTNWLHSFVQDSDQPWVGQLLRRLMDREIDETGSFELLMRTHTGGELIISWNSTLVSEPDGTLLGIISSGEDVTARRRAEETLRRAEARQRLAMEAATMGWWDWEAVTGRVTYGGIYEAILGMPASALNSAPDSLFRRIHPEDQTRVKRLLVRIAEGQDVFETEYRVLRLDGSVAWAHSRGQAYRDASGALQRVIGIIQNIEDRKQGEAKLLMANSTLSSTIEATGDAILVSDLGGKALTCNQKFLSIIRLRFEELAATTPADFLQRIRPMVKNYEGFAQFVGRATHDPQFTGADLVELIDGRVFERYTHPLRRGRELAGRVWSYRDITARHRSEEALRESETRLRRTLESAYLGTWDLDLVTRRLVTGGTHELLFGFDAGSGTALDEVFDRVHQDDRLHIEQAIAFSGRTRAPFSIEFRVMIAGQGFRWLRTQGQVINPADQPPSRILGVIWDVTQRRNVEEDLRRSEQALRNSLLEKEAMLKEIHHRVKNNLQLVSSLMRLRSNQLQSGEARDALENTQSRIRSMALLHEALYCSGNLASINLQDYVSRLATQILRAANCSEGVEIATETDPLSVSLDTAIPCGLIINELVVNSLKHAFPAEGQGRVTVQLKRSDESQVRLTVSDNGCGLPSGLDIERLESLGLHLVCDLVRQLGGQLEFFGPPGARFCINFPLTVPAGSQIAPV